LHRQIVYVKIFIKLKMPHLFTWGGVEVQYAKSRHRESRELDEACAKGATAEAFSQSRVLKAGSSVNN
jgi:hypothetical protein